MTSFALPGARFNSSCTLNNSWLRSSKVFLQKSKCVVIVWNIAQMKWRSESDGCCMWTTVNSRPAPSICVHRSFLLWWYRWSRGVYVHASRYMCVYGSLLVGFHGMSVYCCDYTPDNIIKRIFEVYVMACPYFDFPMLYIMLELPVCAYEDFPCREKIYFCKIFWGLRRMILVSRIFIEDGWWSLYSNMQSYMYRIDI